jgi:hypothetical protein
MANTSSDQRHDGNTAKRETGHAQKIWLLDSEGCCDGLFHLCFGAHHIFDPGRETGDGRRLTVFVFLEKQKYFKKSPKIASFFIRSEEKPEN